MTSHNLIKTGDDFIKVESPIIGKLYHIDWAYRGAKFKLSAILKENGHNYCILRTPTNNKRITCKLESLRELRK